MNNGWVQAVEERRENRRYLVVCFILGTDPWMGYPPTRWYETLKGKERVLKKRRKRVKKQNRPFRVFQWVLQNELLGRTEAAIENSQSIFISCISMVGCFFEPSIEISKNGNRARDPNFIIFQFVVQGKKTMIRSSLTRLR